MFPPHCIDICTMHSQGESLVSFRTVIAKAIKFLKIYCLPFSQVLFIFCVTKWEVCMKHLSCIQKYLVILRDITYAVVWVVSWTSSFCFHGRSYLLNPMTEREYGFAGLFISRHFLKMNKKHNKPATSKKTMNSTS